jgi:hypothetical protein
METQAISVQIPVESANSSTPTIVVDQILPSRNKPGFQGIVLRWHTERSNQDNGSILSFALGGVLMERRVAIQTFAKEVIAKHGIKPGVNLNEVLKKAGMPLCRIAIKEITESEYNTLNTQAQGAFRPKENPTTQMPITHQGEQVYRSVTLKPLSVQDVYLQSDSSVEVASSDDNSGLAI